MTPPTVVIAPTKPTAAQYIQDPLAAPEDGTVLIRNPVWVTYEADLALYQQYQKDLAEYEATVAQAKQSLTDKLYHIQLRASQLTREIESILDSKWAALLEDGQWLRSFFDTRGGVGEYMTVDYVDGVGKENRFYVTTYVTDWGEESAPSDVSAWHSAGYRDWVNITAPTQPSGRTDIIGWRLYRGNVGTQQAQFQLVTIESTDEQAAKAAHVSGVFDRFVFGSGLVFKDKVPSDRLGEVLPTATWLPPPAELKGLVTMPNGILAGYVGNTIHFCEPFVPYAWPAEYQVTVDSRITGLGVFGQTLFVGTEANPYFVSGADPATMSAQKLETNQACVSRRSVASVQGGVLFASPDGLCAADSSGVRLLTQGVFTREEWQALSPSTMVGIEHESIYYLFHSGGCLTFDMTSKKLGRVAGLTGVTAAFVDRLDDRLYVVIANQILPFNAGSTRLTGKWKSGKMTLPAQAGLSWLKVYGDQTVDAPVTVKWYGDGALRHTATVNNLEAQRLPPGRWLEHEVEIESQARLTRVVMAGSLQELQSV